MKSVTTPKIVRVRIAVAVSPNGEWAAAGYSGNKSDNDVKEMVFIDGLPDGEQFHWIEADVPIPQVETIEGKVA